MTHDQAKALIEGLAAENRRVAEHYRQTGDEYKRNANAATDANLAQLHFNQSSEFYAQARQCDRIADAIDMIL